MAAFWTAMASMDMAAKRKETEAPRATLPVAQVGTDAPRTTIPDAPVVENKGAQVCGDCGLTTRSVEAQDLVGEGTLRKRDSEHGDGHLAPAQAIAVVAN